MWNVKLVALRAMLSCSIINYYSILNIHYSIAMQFHRVLPSGRNFSTLVEKIIKQDVVRRKKLRGYSFTS